MVIKNQKEIVTIKCLENLTVTLSMLGILFIRKVLITLNYEHMCMCMCKQSCCPRQVTLEFGFSCFSLVNAGISGMFQHAKDGSNFLQ